MMMQRGHLEDPLFPELVRNNLYYHRHCFENKNSAYNNQEDLFFYHQGNNTQHAPQGQASGVPHEDLRWMSIVPEEAHARPYKGKAGYGELPTLTDVGYQEILSVVGTSRQVGQQCKGKPDQDNKTNGQSVETVGKIHRVGCKYQQKNRKRNIQQSEIDHRMLEERYIQKGCILGSVHIQIDDDPSGDQHLPQQL